MEAREKNFRDIMQVADVFKIPFFQRAYVWGKENWERFFNDLHESFEENSEHFLGSVILKKSSGNENYATVIDGQQRLTTFSILFKALYDKLAENRKQDFRICIFARHKSNDSPKILHSKLDRTAYMQIFSEPSANTQKNNIINAYLFFQNAIKEKFDANDEMEDKIFQFMRFLEDAEIFVSVCLDSKEDEQKIFDSINSTGEPLSATDIIKNALFDRIIKESGEEKAIELYEKFWAEVFEKDEKQRVFWNTKIGREQRYKSEIFLHAFAIVEGFFDYSKKHNIAHLANLYKEHIKAFDSEKLEVFLEKIYHFALIYREFPQITYGKDNTTLFRFEDWRLRLFHIMSEFDITTILPLLLVLEHILKDDKDALKKNFHLLEMFLLCNDEMKSYNKFFARLTKNLPTDNVEIYEFLREQITESFGKNLTKKAIQERLKNIKNKNAKLILFHIELFRESLDEDKDKYGSPLHYSYSLEHLMPRKWQEHWSSVAENKEKAEELIYQIGNMTLLREKLNVSLQNKEWDKKLNGNSKSDRCIRKNAMLLINQELLDKEQWSADSIKERTEKLSEDFFKIWDINVFNT